MEEAEAHPSIPEVMIKMTPLVHQLQHCVLVVGFEAVTGCDEN
jgi:hypothetical protein